MDGGGNPPVLRRDKKSPVVIGLRYPVYNISLGLPLSMLFVVDSLLILMKIFFRQ